MRGHRLAAKQEMFYRDVTFTDPVTGRQVKVPLMEVYSHDTYVPGFWQEHAISDCPLGCKVYRGGLILVPDHPDSVEPRLVLMHNSNYGCQR